MAERYPTLRAQPAMTGYLQLARTPRGNLLAAAMPHKAPRVWPITTQTLPSADAICCELAHICSGVGLLVCASTADLAPWLSAPHVLRQARDILPRLVDIREALLFVAPELHEFSLEEFCRQDALPCPSPAELDTFALRWEQVVYKLRDRASRMSGEARSLIATAAGPAWPGQLLGVPEIGIGATKAIAAMLPTRPGRARPTSIGRCQRLEDIAATALGPGGGVATAHPGYEHRVGQVDMARGVAAAFEREEFLLVEAGTGTGKSLAYLIPAIAFARSRGVPVIVSTNTKNLQDQLVRRDIPLAARALGMEFAAEVLKGRANYLCPRLLASAIARAELSVFRDERLALGHLVAWASSVPIADLDGLSSNAFAIAPALHSVIPLVRARAESCAGRECTYYQCCPAEVARARAQNADIVVVNHALLLAGTGTAVLPEYEHVVIDEAHNLEDVATEHLGREVTNSSLWGLLRRLGGDGQPAINERVLEWLEASGIREESVEESLALFPQAVAGLQYALENLAAAVLGFVSRTRFADCQDERISVRLTPVMRETRDWQAVVEALGPVNSAIEAVMQLLVVLRATLRTAGNYVEELGAAIALEVEQCIAQLDDLRGTLAIIVEGESGDNFVCWASSWTTREGELGWELRAAPIDVGPALRDALYAGLATLVMTSATLTVEGSFRYVRQRLGLDTESHRLLELTVPSPFDFTNQLLLCIPSDLPLPNEPGFEQAASEAIYEAATMAGGGTLCLFTSRDSMSRAFEQLYDRLRAHNLTPVCQDLAASRTAALELLRDNAKTVLFGVKSFWEGVDVPGEALRCLVMTKLPFPVPTDPIIEARQERVEEQGLNGYNDYYVPTAVIGFRQGIGRLIRTRSDYGVVFVLDRRIVLRPYGRRFLESIPTCRTALGSLQACLAEARAMLHPVS